MYGRPTMSSSVCVVDALFICLVVVVLVCPSAAFNIRRPISSFSACRPTSTHLRGQQASTSTSAELLDALRDEGGDSTSPLTATERITSLVDSLEESYLNKEVVSTETSPFTPLLGLYDVAAVIPSKPNENPVGGKWTRPGAKKLLRIRGTYQHLVPQNSTGYRSFNVSADSVVAEAVNVISLGALFGLIRLNVILRGDAIPLTGDERKTYEDSASAQAKERKVPNKVGSLSSLTVRAKFDPPRIVFGRRGKILNLNLGPRSSVILDTTFCDKTVRIGKGGTSGTKFVFRRLPSDDIVANEWRGLLNRKPLRKRKALVVLGSILGWSIRSAVKRQAKALPISMSALSVLFGAIVLFSSGGIEEADE